MPAMLPWLTFSICPMPHGMWNKGSGLVLWWRRVSLGMKIERRADGRIRWPHLAEFSEGSSGAWAALGPCVAVLTHNIARRLADHAPAEQVIK